MAEAHRWQKKTEARVPKNCVRDPSLQRAEENTLSRYGSKIPRSQFPPYVRRLDMEKLRHTTGCVYQTAYHIVWRPMYRKEILREPVKSTLEHLLHTIAYKNGMEILAVDIQPDPIHLLVSFPPALSIADAVKL